MLRKVARVRVSKNFGDSRVTFFEKFAIFCGDVAEADISAVPVEGDGARVAVWCELTLPRWTFWILSPRFGLPRVWRVEVLVRASS